MNIDPKKLSLQILKEMKEHNINAKQAAKLVKDHAKSEKNPAASLGGATLLPIELEKGQGFWIVKPKPPFKTIGKLQIKKRGGILVIHGTDKLSGDDKVTKVMFPFSKFPDEYNVKLFLQKLTETKSLSKSLTNPQKSWIDLKSISAPKEKGDSYIMDAKSSGIYSPVLEGSHLMNPRNKMAQTYIKYAVEAETMGNNFKASGDIENAFKYYTIAYKIAEIAGTVKYYYNVRADKLETSKKIDKLITYIDSVMSTYRNELNKKREEMMNMLVQQNKQSRITTIEREIVESLPSNVNIKTKLKKENEYAN